MKKIRAQYTINFDEYSQMRNVMSLEDYDKIIKNKITSELINRVIEDDLIEINKTKERFCGI